MSVTFKGSMTALITPMNEDGSVDEKAFQNFVQWQIDEGTDGLVPVGTTGESATLDHAEHERVISLCLEVAKGKVPVIAGAGSNSTREAVSLTKHAASAGADATLAVTPYYNKPSQEGMYQHFKAVAEAADLPVFIYNIPDVALLICLLRQWHVWQMISLILWVSKMQRLILRVHWRHA